MTWAKSYTVLLYSWTYQKHLTLSITSFNKQGFTKIGIEKRCKKENKNRHCVFTDGFKSELLEISKGVPQGLILGPYFISYYIYIYK